MNQDVEIVKLFGRSLFYPCQDPLSRLAGEVGNWVSEWRIADLGNGEVMCVMNVTDMESFGAFMSSPEEAQWDKDNGAVYKAYMMQEMEG